MGWGSGLKCTDCAKNTVCLNHRGAHNNCFVPLRLTNEQMVRSMSYFEARRLIVKQIQVILGDSISQADAMRLVDELYEWFISKNKEGMGDKIDSTNSNK